MTTYYSGPRVRLPSNRSLQLSDAGASSSSSSPLAQSPASAPVLIFPAPPSEPASPHPQSTHPRTRSLAHGALRLRHTRVDSNASSIPTTATSSHVRVDSTASTRVRVDSNASSASLIASASATDLSSPRFSLVNSPRFVRSAAASDWSDIGAVSGPSTGGVLSPGGSSGSALTRDRIVRLGSARVIPSSWRRSGSGGSGSGSLEVEMWEWTSTGSEVDGERDRGWAENETNYEDALSQFHFPTLEESRWACVGGEVDAPEAAKCASVMMARPEAVSARPAHPALGQRVVRLPFRFLLETVLSINPATLMLLERGGHEPESISETGLFGTEIKVDEDEIEAIESSAERRVLFDLDGGMVRRGLNALAESVVVLPLPLIPIQVSICLVASIPGRVWAGLSMPTIPKWRVGQR